MSDEYDSDLKAIEQSLSERLAEIRRLRRLHHIAQVERGVKERTVSDHAVLRFMSRVMKVDTEAVRAEIRRLADECSPVKDGEHYWHPSGVVLILGDGGQVVTVLGEEQSQKFIGRKLLHQGRATLAEIASGR